MDMNFNLPCSSRQVVPDEDHVQPAKGVKVNGEGRGPKPKRYSVKCGWCGKHLHFSECQHSTGICDSCREKELNNYLEEFAKGE